MRMIYLSYACALCYAHPKFHLHISPIHRQIYCRLNAYRNIIIHFFTFIIRPHKKGPQLNDGQQFERSPTETAAIRARQFDITSQSKVSGGTIQIIC